MSSDPPYHQNPNQPSLQSHGNIRQVWEQRGNPKKPSPYSGNDLSNYVFGKVQPQAIPVEEAVLGAIMLDKDAMPTVLDILKPESFYLEAHQHIFRAMLALFEKSQPIDLMTVHEELRKQGTFEKVGGMNYVVELTNRVASAANIEYHARIIAQKQIQRDLIQVSTHIIRDAYEDTTDVFKLLDNAEKGLFAIAQNHLTRSYEGMGSLATAALRQIQELAGKPQGGLTGIPSGFTNLDRVTAGWQPSDLIILAARPGMGKTSMVLALARNAAMDYRKGVAIFSLEMSNLQLVQRLIAMEAEISASKLRSGQLGKSELDKLEQVVQLMSEVPIFIDDTPGINIFELRAKCRRLKMQHNIQMVIIDYLQLMSGNSEMGRGGGNREQEISSISRSLKAMAKELQVPVIALSQLSRAVETRGGSKRPQLSDLRESGAIEQDADIVSFIYRPEYYQILEDEQGASLKNMAEFIIAKHRNGALDTVKLQFINEFAKFKDLDAFGFEVNDHSPLRMASEDAFSYNSHAQQPIENNMITRPSKMNDDQDVPF